MSNYPNEYDVFHNPNAEPYTHSELHKKTNSAITAIQTTMGLNPQSSEDSLTDRIIAIQTELDQLQDLLDEYADEFGVLTSGEKGELLTGAGSNNVPTFSSVIPDNIAQLQSDAFDLRNKVNLITDGEGRIRLPVVDDVSLTSTTHAFQIATDNTANLNLDPNEIMSRNTGVGANLFLQADGGALSINTSSTYQFEISNGRLQGTSISNFITYASGWTAASSAPNEYAYRIGGFLLFLARAERTGGTISPNAAGDITNSELGTLSTACRGNLNVNIPVRSGGTGPLCTGAYNPSTGLLTLAAVGTSADIPNGEVVQLGGLVWIGNSD